MQLRGWLLALAFVALVAARANASVPITQPVLAVAGARAESVIAFASSAEVLATAGSSSPPASQPPDATFPSEVAGLPVLSVAEAVELLQSGQLDGQAVAVAGYYSASAPSCPPPAEYMGPFDDWCHYVAFADTRSGAQMCHPFGDSGMSCSRPSGTNLAPFFENETSGDPWLWLTGGSEPGEPEAFVLIGHAGDARQWQCTASAQDACAHAFVVDRIAWANGSDVPIEVPQTLDKDTHKPLAPSMTLGQITAVIGPDNELVAAAPFRAGDIASIDPRWNFAGDDVLWIARSLGPTPTPGGSTRPETVWLIEYATGLLIDSHPQRLDPSYQPARLWQMSTVHGRQCCNGDTLAFYRVESSDGAALFDGRVPGDGSSSSESGAATFGGGYGSEPLVLPAGDYTVTAWLASYDHGVVGPPRRECSTQVTLGPLDDVMLNADYPHKLACTFKPAPSASPTP